MFLSPPPRRLQCTIPPTLSQTQSSPPSAFLFDERIFPTYPEFWRDCQATIRLEQQSLDRIVDLRFAYLWIDSLIGPCISTAQPCVWIGWGVMPDICGRIMEAWICPHGYREKARGGLEYSLRHSSELFILETFRVLVAIHRYVKSHVCNSPRKRDLSIFDCCRAVSLTLQPTTFSGI